VNIVIRHGNRNYHNEFLSVVLNTKRDPKKAVRSKILSEIRVAVSLSEHTLAIELRVE